MKLLHPVIPNKLIAIGLNYRDHAEESELDIPATPVVFAKWTSSLIGHGAPIVIPREETRPDFEGELAVVLASRLYRADAEQARAAVGGITVVHDVSGRRAQLETPLRQLTLGKSFSNIIPTGPWRCLGGRDRPGRHRHHDHRFGRADAVVQHVESDLLGRRADPVLLPRDDPGTG